jgi:hypothetical protein
MARIRPVLNRDSSQIEPRGRSLSWSTTRGGEVTRKRSLVAVVALVAAIALSAVGTMGAAAGGSAQSARNTLAGSWDVAVDRPAPLSDLRSLQTFTENGSVVEIANGGATVRSPSHGAWKRVAGRDYASTIVFFRYDPQSGAYLGTQKINRTITLSQDGKSFTGIGISTLFDPAGNVLVSGLQAPETGTRIEVE